MPITLNGLASGLDTESIISQLMAIEQNKVTAVQRRQIAVQQHKTDLTTIKTQARRGQDRGRRPRVGGDVEARADHELVRPDQGRRQDARGAGIGGHSLQVHKLASSAQHGFTFTPNAAAGTITLFYGSDPNAAGNSQARRSTVAANATATDVATLINANEGSPVYAAVVKDGADERLVFSARKTGENSNFTVDTSALAGGQLAEVPARTPARARRSTPRTRSTARLRRALRSPTSSRTRSRASA